MVIRKRPGEDSESFARRVVHTAPRPSAELREQLADLLGGTQPSTPPAG